MEIYYEIMDFYNTSDDYKMLWELINNDKQVIYFYDVWEARKDFDKHRKYRIKPLNIQYTSAILKRFMLGKFFYAYFCSLGTDRMLNLSRIDCEGFIERCKKYNVLFIIPNLEVKKE